MIEHHPRSCSASELRDSTNHPMIMEYGSTIAIPEVWGSAAQPR
jgi:hypothetical protein